MSKKQLETVRELNEGLRADLREARVRGNEVFKDRDKIREEKNEALVELRREKRIVDYITTR